MGKDLGVTPTGPGCEPTASAASASSQSRIPNAERDQALRLAYGLLWHMHIDRENQNLRLASDARRALLTVMSKDEQADGIARAKAVDARFTGAA